MNKLNTQNVKLEGLSSQIVAARLSIILLAVPTGVMAFNNGDTVTLKALDREMEITPDGSGEMCVTTQVKHYAPQVNPLSDRETARRIMRFFGSRSAKLNRSTNHR